MVALRKPLWEADSAMLAAQNNGSERSDSQAPRAVLRQKSEPVVPTLTPLSHACPSSCHHDYLSLKEKTYDPGEEAHTPASPSILAFSVPKAKKRSLKFRKRKYTGPFKTPVISH